MKRSRKHQSIFVGILLILLSVFCYTIHYAIFRDAHHIFIYLVGDIAFVFIEVLLVSLIIQQILSNREKRSILQKLNMVIGAFFTRMGTDMLRYLSAFDTNREAVARDLVVEQDWSSKHFARIGMVMNNHKDAIDAGTGDIESLKMLLLENGDFVLRLLENQNLLEHESFTELLWAVSHLTEELSHRQNLQNLTDTDKKHLAGDMRRAYRLLMLEWLSYMEHLNKEYPYLFSLAVRTNPFDPTASVEFT